MKSRIAPLLMFCTCGLALTFGQTAAPPSATPTETTAADIPGVVAGGTKVRLIARDLRGTEGPIAAPDGSLLFTEQTASVITKVDANGNRSTYLEKTDAANGLTFDSKGRLLGTRPDIHAIAVLTPAPRLLTDAAEGQPLMRPNDLIADRKGGVYFTDPGPNLPAGQSPPRKPAVYYIKPDGSVVKIADDITRPNGVMLSPDEQVLYVADTLGPAVIAFDVQPDGTGRNRREFGRLEGVTKTEAGVRSGADGLAVDQAGRLYVATQAGVQVFSPQGQRLGTIPIGVAGGPQNIAFAGKDKRTLYVVGRGAMWTIAMLAQGPRDRAK
jgi:gluconolactonase